MLIAFDTRTGNVRRFIDKVLKSDKAEALNIKAVEISEGLSVNESFVLVTYTDGFGKVPQSTLDFLENNDKHLVGISASGNKNWGSNFAKSAEIIYNKYKYIINNLRLISRFEMSGGKKDIETFLEGVEIINEEVYRIK